MPTPRLYELGEDLYQTTRIYTRCSSDAQEEDANEGGRGEPSTASQQHELYALAQTIPCRTIEAPDRYCDSVKSATETRLEQRPGIQLLLEEVRRGDLVLVWSLERAVRGSFEVAAFLRLLADRGVSILSKAQFVTTPLRLDGIMAVSWASAMDMASAINWAERSEVHKHWHRNYQEQGRYPGGPLRFGRKIVERIESGKKTKCWEWDNAEVEAILEAHERNENGESMADIARDFDRRNVRRHDGSPLGTIYAQHARRNGRRIRGRAPYPNPVVLYEAVRLVKYCRKMGIADPRELHPGTLQPLRPFEAAEKAVYTRWPNPRLSPTL